MNGLGIIALIVFGSALGSFAAAMVWRLRALQLKEDKADGEKIDPKEFARLQPLLAAPVSRDRSQCLQCHHPLAWYDLIPLYSWVSLRGKCRYCHRGIGYFEPLMELGMAVFFVVSFLVWPYGALDQGIDIVRFGIWLVAGVLLAILCAYDAKWFLLPNRVMYPLIGLGFVMVTVAAIQSGTVVTTLASAAGACAILSGLYLLLYIVSRGAWVGFGDVKLGLALALLLVDWKLAVLALFAANVVGTFIVLPGMMTRRLSRKAHIPFGPMLIAGWIIAGLFGTAIIDWYLHLVVL